MQAQRREPSPSRQPLFTVAEAATLAGVSRQAVNLWLQAGLVRGERIGRWWVVDRASLESHLRTRRECVPSTDRGTEHERQHQEGFEAA
jgi:excisionase family DNA binding protein